MGTPLNPSEKRKIAAKYYRLLRNHDCQFNFGRADFIVAYQKTKNCPFCRRRLKNDKFAFLRAVGINGVVELDNISFVCPSCFYKLRWGKNYNKVIERIHRALNILRSKYNISTIKFQELLDLWLRGECDRCGCKFRYLLSSRYFIVSNNKVEIICENCAKLAKIS